MFSPFDPSQLQILAENFYKYPEEYCPSECKLECIYRIVINRSYYASFLYARNWLEKQFHFMPVHPSYDKQHRGAHKQVIDELKKKSKNKASNNLLELKRIRKNADYDIGVNDYINQSDAKNSIYLAKKVFENI